MRALAKSEKVLKSSAGFVAIIINQGIYRESRERKKTHTHTRRKPISTTINESRKEIAPKELHVCDDYEASLTLSLMASFERYLKTNNSSFSIAKYAKFEQTRKALQQKTNVSKT